MEYEILKFKALCDKLYYYAEIFFNCSMQEHASRLTALVGFELTMQIQWGGREFHSTWVFLNAYFFNFDANSSVCRQKNKICKRKLFAIHFSK